MVPWKKYGFNYSGVYLVAPDNKWPIKIGHSDSVARRVSELQTAHWQAIGCFGYWLCENKKAAQQVEAKVHDLLIRGARHLAGEWFDVDVRKAAEIVQFAGDALNVELATSLPKAEKFKDVIAYLNIAAPRELKKGIGAVNGEEPEEDDDSFTGAPTMARELRLP